jgi:hypothetical protein
MKWPWSRPDPEPEQDDRQDQINEAREARKTSEHDLARVREMREEVEHVVDHLREIRTRNHLLDAFQRSLRKRDLGHD